MALEAGAAGMEARGSLLIFCFCVWLPLVLDL
jgi:hypothetical protein